MSDSAYLASLVPADELLAGLLDASLMGVVLYSPVLDPAGELVDFAFSYLNPAAQRLLRLPARPAITHLAAFPGARANGSFEIHRAAFLTGEPKQLALPSPDALTPYSLRAAARRVGAELLVSLTEAVPEAPAQPPAPAPAEALAPPAAEAALRASQTRERTARANAERQRNLLRTLLHQAPVAIAVLEGPDCVVTLVNQQMADLWGHPLADILNEPLLTAVPELRGQGFELLIADVARTRMPYVGREVPTQLLRAGRLDTGYFNFVYQPLYDEAGAPSGVVYVAIDVTELVLARRRAEENAQRAAALNQRLLSTNQELLSATAAAEQTRADAEAGRRELTALFQQAPAMICILSGPDHTFELVNPPYQRLVGDRLLLGRPIREAMPELAGQPFFGLLAEVYRTGESFSAHEMLVRLDHDNSRPAALAQRYYNFTYQPRRDAQGGVNGIIVFAYDVTALVETRQRVEDNEHLLATTNEELQAINEELQAANTELQTAQSQLLELNQCLETRVRERTQQFEAALGQAERQREQVELQQHLLRQILGQVPASICALSGPEHCYSFFNEAYQQQAGGRARLGVAMGEAMPEAATQGFIALLDEVYATGKPYIGRDAPVRFHDPAALSASRVGYFDFIFQPLVDGQGQTQGILAFAVDVTEKMRARQQLEDLSQELADTNATLRQANAAAQAANEQLTRANVDLDNFIYTASHDLRAPILNIDGLLHALEQELPAVTRQTPDVAPLLTMMHDAVARFQKTVDDLTEITRLRNAHEAPATLVRLADVVESVRLDLAPQINATGAALTIDVADCPAIAFAERNLRSVVYNLLSNALKYRDPTRPLRVQLSARPAGEFVELTVQDNGLGLAAHRQPELFSMFKRFHSHVEGSGIGLYMVKKIVENAGGRVEVMSEDGQGFKFRVLLRPEGGATPCPRAAAEKRERPEKPERPEKSGRVPENA